MQNAKDSFYVALRERLKTLDPARIIMLRGVQRPGIAVEEAEAPVAELMNDVFVLRWTASNLLQESRSALISMQCELQYATSGSEPNFGLDRGRAMTAMDRALISILQPMKTPKMRFTVTPAVEMQTAVFWTEPVLGILETKRNQLIRVAKVTVYAFEEPGE